MKKTLLTAALVALLTTPLSEKAYADYTNVPWQNLTLSQLTAAWWQWLYSVPASISPALDGDEGNVGGVNAYSGQPYSTLLFLAGTYKFVLVGSPPAPPDVVGIVERSIKVKEGTALFFPLVDYEADNNCRRPSLGGNCGGPPTLPANMGAAQLQQVAAAQTDCPTGLIVTLTPMDEGFDQQTGSPVPVGIHRLQSPPFSYTLPRSGNLIQVTQGIPVSGTVSPVASDGYFSLVAAGQLTQGYYSLHYEGAVPLLPPPSLMPGGPPNCSPPPPPPGNFIQKITYHITVTP